MEDLALIPAHDLADVVLHDALQFSLVADGGYPRRELRVPHYGVPVSLLATDNV